jgi:hypothetical protein
MPDHAPILELLLTVHGTPPCTRLLRISGGATLDRLHRVLATSLGWPNGGRYAFIARRDEQEISYEGEFPRERSPGRRQEPRVRQLVQGRGDRLVWECGDDLQWTGDVLVRAELPYRDDVATPACADGRGAAPNFVLGPWGQDAHAGRVGFDAAAVNAALAALRRRR